MADNNNNNNNQTGTENIDAVYDSGQKDTAKELELFEIKKKILDVEQKLRSVRKLQELESRGANEDDLAYQKQLLSSLEQEIILENNLKELQVAEIERSRDLKKISDSVAEDQIQQLRTQNKELEDYYEALKKVILLKEQDRDLSSKVAEQEKRAARQRENDLRSIKRNIFEISDGEMKRKFTLTQILDAYKTFSPLEITDSIIAAIKKLPVLKEFTVDKMKEYTLSYDKLITSLNAATNQSGRYNAMLVELASSNARFGITGEAAVKAIGGLHESYADFTELSDSSRQSLATLSAQMERVGLSTASLGAFLNTATRALGMGRIEAQRYIQDLLAFSNANQINFKTILNGISSIGPKLAAFGRDGKQVLKDLAFEAKKLGLEMADVLNISEQFTTFEGAAEIAGELNSMLGGNFLDPLQMMKISLKDPVEAVEELRSVLKQTNKDFTDLTGAEARAFATALKTDPDKLAALFKMTSKQIRDAHYTQEQYNKAIASMVPLTEKIQALIGKLAPVFETLASGVGKVVDVLAKMADTQVGKTVFIIIGIFTIFLGVISSIAIGIIGLIVPIVALVVGPISLLTKGATGLIGGLKGVISGLLGIGSTAPVAGASITGVISSIGAAITAFSEVIIPAAIALGLVGLAAYSFAKAYEAYKNAGNIKVDTTGINALSNFNSSKLDTITEKLKAMNEQMAKLSEFSNTFVSNLGSLNNFTASAAIDSRAQVQTLTVQSNIVKIDPIPPVAVAMASSQNTANSSNPTTNEDSIIHVVMDAPIQLDGTTLGYVFNEWYTSMRANGSNTAGFAPKTYTPPTG